MYILLKESLPDSFAPLVAAHASLACFRAFENNENMQSWIGGSFKKVVCRVNEKEFAKAKTFDDVVVLTESALDNEEVCVVACPREEFPKPFRFYKMWTPTDD
ncbi:MAG: hypothetical protein AAF683_05980 [Pseudomonadota bacterium]